MMKNVHGDQCMSRTRCFEWFKQFKDGQQSTHDEPHLGWPSMSCDDTHVAQFHEIVHSNHRLTVREIVEDGIMSLHSYDKIRNGLGGFKVCSMTSDTGSERQPRCHQELLDHGNENENFLKRIITSNETWVYGYDVKTKMQSSLWVGKNSQRLKKARQVKSKVKEMFTDFFTSRVLGIMNSYVRAKQ
jgi:hypothetical protein